MAATNLVEKHEGYTLVVSGGWLTVVDDKTGYQFAGPVDTDEEVRWLVGAAIRHLHNLRVTGEFMRKKVFTSKKESPSIEGL